MKRDIILFAAAGAFALSPVLAAPGGGGGGGGRSGGGGAAMHGPMTTTRTAPTTSHSPTGNGGGYDHLNSPQHVTGQPMASCETTGSPPGGSGTAPGSAFSGGTADEHYAGEQPQNSRNTASSSQYDVACTHQPH